MSSFLSSMTAEFRRIFRDPAAILILVVAVILYSFFYPAPYSQQTATELSTVIIDFDNSSRSRQFSRMLDANQLVKVSSQVENPWQAQQLIKNGEAVGMIIIPRDFERRLLRGEQARILAYVDSSYFLMYRQVMSGIVATTATFSAGVEVRRFQTRGHSEEVALRLREPVATEHHLLFNPTGGYGYYVVPGVFILVLQQTLLIGLGILGGTERESKGAVTRPKGSVLTMILGRTAAYVVLYCVHMLFLLLVPYRLFGFPSHGSVYEILLFILPFIIATTFLAFALSTLFKRRESAMQILLFASLPAILLSGFSWPPEATPWWLHAAAHAIPSTSAVPGFLRLNQMGASFSDVIHEWTMLWILAAAYLIPAWLLLHSRSREFVRTST